MIERRREHVPLPAGCVDRRESNAGYDVELDRRRALWDAASMARYRHALTVTVFLTCWLGGTGLIWRLWG